MALYEIVLSYPDRDEVRLTDQPAAVGDRVVIDYDDWIVVEARKPEDIRATARLMCELATSQRTRAAKMRTDDKARRSRFAELERRRLGLSDDSEDAEE